MENPWRELSAVDPQPESGFRRIENHVYATLTAADLTAAEYKVCLAIIGRTWGRKLPHGGPITMAELCADTRLSSKSVKRARQALREKRIICYDAGEGTCRGGRVTEYLVNKFWDTWQVDKPLATDPESGDSPVPGSAPKVGTRTTPVSPKVGTRMAESGDTDGHSHIVERKKESKRTPDTGKTKAKTEGHPSANSDHVQIRDFFCSEYEKKFGVRYAFCGGKDGQVLKTLLITFGLEKLREIVIAFLGSDDPFLREKSGFTIGALRVSANKIAQRLQETATKEIRIPGWGGPPVRRAGEVG